MHTDLLIVLASLFVGFLVGMTGAGGGALMTPILVLGFGIQPLAAISSDLVAAVFMRPVGGFVHWRRGTVHFDLVKWIAISSVPAAFSGVFIIRAMGHGAHLQKELETLLGWTLLVAATAIAVKAAMDGRRRARPYLPGSLAHAVARPLPLLAIGLVGGLMVGMTSVGSGSLMIVFLMLLYPRLRAGELVGTDLVQAVPMVFAAAFAHILYGDFKLAITASVIVGSIPGVFIGARLSSRASDLVVRPVLVVVLLASGLKFVGLSTREVATVAIIAVLVGLPLMGVFDALRRPADCWQRTGLSRRFTIWAQAIGAPFAVGFPIALWYFGFARPRLVAADSDVVVAHHVEPVEQSA